MQLCRRNSFALKNELVLHMTQYRIYMQNIAAQFLRTRCEIESHATQFSQARYETVSPFLPTGQFLAPKIIILMKCLIDILFFSVVLMFL